MPVQEHHSLPKIEPGQPIDDATVWKASDFPEGRAWAKPLEPVMLDEIDAALRQVKTRGIAAKDIRAADFPLDKTIPFLADLYRDIECGPGFALLSGFPVDAYDEEDLRLAYCGVGSHFGTITRQNREGEFILEVMDKGKAYSQQSRGYHSTAHLDFHNDGTNTVVLLCTSTAAEGGLSRLVSGTALYNEILREHPEYLDVLHRGFHHHLRDQGKAGDAAVTPYRTPVFGFFHSLFHMAYAGPSILYCENEGIEISDHEKAALDYLVSVVERPDMQISMELRKGDMQFVNNYLLLHSRTEYRDTPEQQRRLLRLWLDDENSARLGPGKMDWYLPELSRFTQLGGLDALSPAAE